MVLGRLPSRRRWQRSTSMRCHPRRQLEVRRSLFWQRRLLHLCFSYPQRRCHMCRTKWKHMHLVRQQELRRTSGTTCQLQLWLHLRGLRVWGLVLRRAPSPHRQSRGTNMFATIVSKLEMYRSVCAKRTGVNLCFDWCRRRCSLLRNQWKLQVVRQQPVRRACSTARFRCKWRIWMRGICGWRLVLW